MLQQFRGQGDRRPYSVVQAVWRLDTAISRRTPRDVVYVLCLYFRRTDTTGRGKMRYLDPEAQRNHNIPFNYTSHRPDTRPRGRHTGPFGQRGDQSEGRSRADEGRWERGGAFDRSDRFDRDQRGSGDRGDRGDRYNGGTDRRDRGADRGSRGDRWTQGAAARPIFTAASASTSRNLDDDLDRYRSKGEDRRREEGNDADRWRHNDEQRGARAKGWNERFAPAVEGERGTEVAAGAGAGVATGTRDGEGEGGDGGREGAGGGGGDGLLGRIGGEAVGDGGNDEEEDMIIED